MTDGRLTATGWGERVSVDRHQPAVAPRGATYTALGVFEVDRGWYFDNDADGHAPYDALRLMAMVGNRQRALSSLPGGSSS